MMEDRRSAAMKKDRWQAVMTEDLQSAMRQAWTWSV
jgi:hypothetical protein